MSFDYHSKISSENAQAVFSKALDGIICYKVIKDKTGNVTDFEFISLNDSAVKILDAPREKFIGKNFLPLFPGSLESGLFEAFVKAAESKVIQEIEFSYKDKNYEGWFKDTVIPYEDELIVFFKNITENKILEFNLTEKTKQLEQAKKELQISLSEKEMLLKEVHHRVKNNLQIISSIVNLQSSYINDPDASEIFKETQYRIKAIALLHQKLYESKSLTMIDFGMYLRDIITSIFSAFMSDNSRIILELDIDDIELGIDYSIYLGLIFNELITNVIKHAFPGIRNGRLFVSVKQNEQIEIIVRDNGIGLPENMDIFNIDSLGMQLITTLTEQMSGTIKSENSGGAKFTFIIPAKLNQHIV